MNINTESIKKIHDGGLMPNVFLWVKEGLRKPIDALSQIEIQTETREDASDDDGYVAGSQWKQSRPTGKHTVKVSFENGETEQKEFAAL